MTTQSYAATTSPYSPRSIQLVAATPAMLLWGLLAAMAMLWLGSVITRLIFASASPGLFAHWTGPYLLIMTSATITTSIFAFILFLHAYRGRSYLWWHACSLGAAIGFFLLLGIVGD